MDKSSEVKKKAEPALIAALERLHKGDKSSLGVILELTRPRLFRFCFYLTGDMVTAEELAQDTLLRGLGRIKDLKAFEKIYPWLFQIARNLFIDATRTPEHKLMKLQLKGQEETDTYFRNLPDESQGEAETTLAVRDALAKLSPEDRAILILIDHDDYSYDEAAEALKMSTSSLRFRLGRARKAFLTAFEEGGGRYD